MLEVRNLKARIVDTDHIEVTWELTPSTEPSAKYTFSLLRAEAEHGPYGAVAGPFTDHYRVLDDPPMSSRRGIWYYRVRVNGDTEKEFPSTGGVTVLPSADRIGLELARLEHLRLGRGDGRLLVILPRRHFGQICTCVDPITGRILHSTCSTCYRTGYVGGFHNAVRVYGQILDVRPIDRGEEATAFLRMGNTPLLVRGDVVVENENARWLVKHVTAVELHRAVVRQEVQLLEIHGDDPVWSHPVPFSVEDPMEPRIFCRRMTV